MDRESIFALFDILKFGGGGGKGFLGISLLWVISLIFLYFVSFFFLSYKNRFVKFGKLFSPKVITIVFISMISFYVILGFSRRLTKNLIFPDTENIIDLNYKVIKNFYDEDILRINLKDYEDYLTIQQGDKKNLNIVLIFAESLSAIDSARLGGNNNTPYFDKIQESGLTLTNFMSHSNSSLSAHGAVFLGTPPLGDNYKHNKGEPLPKFLNDLGYNTVFISTSDLSFMDERQNFRNRGFKKIIGEEYFENKKHFARGAAPDEDLYNMALKEIQIQTGKYFIALPTISFHSPYDCPYGNSQQQCLKYMDEKLYQFYMSLLNLDFFNNGILIIVGDHRKREPVEAGEYDIFGESYGYRTVATVIGSGIEAGTINKNTTQHTDVYYSLKKLLGTGEVVLDTFYNDMFSFNTHRNRGILSNGYALTSDGNTYLVQKLKELKGDDKEIYYYYLTIKNHFLEEFISTKKKDIIHKKL